MSVVSEVDELVEYGRTARAWIEAKPFSEVVRRAAEWSSGSAPAMST